MSQPTSATKANSYDGDSRGLAAGDGEINMAEQQGVLRRIAWREVIPGLMIFRCFRLATSVSVLGLATCGVLLSPIGHWMAHQAEFGSVPAIPSSPSQTQPIRSDETSVWRNWFSGSILDAGKELVEPVVRLFDPKARFYAIVANLMRMTWNMLVWGIFGGAITRIAVVQLGRQERVPLSAAVQQSVRNLGWYISAPLFPLMGISFFIVLVSMLGMLARTEFGVVVAGVLWPFVLLGGVLATILLTGLFFGWPLMWPTISAEEAGDSFQAFSNSFSFTFQRPISYLGYAIVAVLLGNLGGWFVFNFAEVVVSVSHGALAFGMGNDWHEQIESGQLDHRVLPWAGSGLIAMFDGVVKAVARGYSFAFLFCASSAIYLLLRREVDQTDFDEVFMPNQDTPRSLPTLRDGVHGVPEVADNDRQ